MVPIIVLLCVAALLVFLVVMTYRGNGMARYALKRILLLIPTVLLVCVIVFILLRAVPTSAVDYMIYQFQTAGITVDAAQVEHMLGMDKPALIQFFDWFFGIFRGDLGESLFQTESVWDIISRQLPVTLELGILTLIFSNLISIPLGIYCAARQDSIGDYVIRTISVLLLSLPVFWLATMVLVYPAKWWGYAPPMTYVSFFQDPVENMRMFLVPALLGALTQAGMQLRTVRTMTLEVMRQDYIRTCWAKGVGEKRTPICPRPAQLHDPHHHHDRRRGGGHDRRLRYFGDYVQYARHRRPGGVRSGQPGLSSGPGLRAGIFHFRNDCQSPGGSGL